MGHLILRESLAESAKRSCGAILAFEFQILKCDTCARVSQSLYCFFNTNTMLKTFYKMHINNFNNSSNSRLTNQMSCGQFLNSKLCSDMVTLALE